ncbi:DUF6691 family protein [Aliiglaciecola lipolytica]|uniref:YeeE/YedE family protein n=1 Tax=Aliiglaciecola lipolytica E3 TaxID=1127673 RepID=K6YB18_9ALTE|nr:DUF6691 family protein [Aliiglaciecola lipolytica]GAC13823.1 hypothetical protein GLIP_1182 [Aliiglaciecola lipolytica E3]
MKGIIFGLLSGLLFGIGLTISSMVDPKVVLGFLDLFGAWDPTLAFVMVGGLLVYLPFYHFYVKPKQHTIFGEPCDLPNKKNVDAKLVVGASLFGIGWGLSGICPGPAITNISGGVPGILLFVLAMLIGMMLASRVEKII